MKTAQTMMIAFLITLVTTVQTMAQDVKEGKVNKERHFLFEDFTVEKWITIILIIWAVAIIWAIVTSLIKRIKSEERETSGLCVFGCVIFGIIGGFCTLNLVGNTLKINLGFFTVVFLFIGGGIIGGTSNFIGNLIMSKNRK